MNTNFLTKAIKSVQTAVKKHSPEILTGIGIAGMITTTVLAVRATPKAMLLIEEAKHNQNLENLKTAHENGTDEDYAPVDKLSLADTIKATWTCYIPAFAIGTASVCCLIGASSIHLKRNAALATVYAISESAFKEYQDKVVEEIGEKKEQAVRDNIAKDKVDKNPVSKTEVILTEKGNTLCYDVLSGRYFKSDIDAIKKAENELNRQMKFDDYVTLNEFYAALGLSDIKIGDTLGWDIAKGYIDLDFSSQLADDGTPCLVIGHHVAPQHTY